MKKILVLGALSLFCLSNASAMLTQAVDSQKQEKNDFKVRVTEKEGGNDKEKSFAEVKLDSIHSLELPRLNTEDVNAALTVLSRRGIFDLKNTILDQMNLTLEQQYLYIVASELFKALRIWQSAIDGTSIPILLQVLKNNPGLTSFVQLTLYNQKTTIKDELDICLALKNLPILGEGSLRFYKDLQTLTDKLLDLNLARKWMLVALNDCVKYQIAKTANEYVSRKDKVEEATALLDKEIFDVYIGNAVSEYQQAFTELESLASKATGQEAKVLLAAEKIRKTAEGSLLCLQYDTNRRVEKFIREMTVLVVKMKDVEKIEEFQKVMKKTPEELKTAAESLMQLYQKLEELDKKLAARIEAELGVLDLDAEKVELNRAIAEIRHIIVPFELEKAALSLLVKGAKTAEELKAVMLKIQEKLRAEIKRKVVDQKITSAYTELAKVFEQKLVQLAALGKKIEMIESMEKIQGELQGVVESWQHISEEQVDKELMKGGKELAEMFKQRLEQLAPMGTKEAEINDQKEMIASIMKDFIASVEDQCGIIQGYINTKDRDERKGIIINTFGAINNKLEAFFVPVDATLQKKMQAAQDAGKEDESRTLEKQLVEFDDARKAAQEKLKELCTRAWKVFEENADNAIAKIESFKEESGEIIRNREMKWRQMEEEKI